MQFLKTIFWAMIAVVAAIFSFNNWNLVTISLWNGLQMDMPLPLLLGIAFLVGLVPTYLLHRTTRWSLNRKLSSAERALAVVRAPDPVVAKGTLPPSAAPIAAPPGVS